MKLDFFVKLKCQRSTAILSFCIKYFMCVQLCDVNYSTRPVSLVTFKHHIPDLSEACLWHVLVSNKSIGVEDRFLAVFMYQDVEINIKSW